MRHDRRLPPSVCRLFAALLVVVTSVAIYATVIVGRAIATALDRGSDAQGGLSALYVVIVVCLISVLGAAYSTSLLWQMSKRPLRS